MGSFAMIVWCIWNHRNNWVWNGVKDSARDVALRAGHMIQEWRVINSSQIAAAADGRSVAAAARVSAVDGLSTARVSHGMQLLRWEKPRDGWWKCNVDASLTQNPNMVAWGWCIRDARGAFIAAGTNSCSSNVSVAEAEALGLLEAMREATVHGWFNIIFESDAKVVVDAIHATHHGNSEWSSLISSIKLLLHSYPNFEVKFIKWQANIATHTLARAAYSWPSCMFFNSVPGCIEPFIINEMT
jgi:ribonuclease HI